MPSSIDSQIRSQIGFALKDLGADEKLLSKVESMTPNELYNAAERLKAESMLLAFIGSWKDTLTDKEILECLRGWNAETKLAQK